MPRDDTTAKQDTRTRRTEAEHGKTDDSRELNFRISEIDNKLNLLALRLAEASRKQR